MRPEISDGAIIFRRYKKIRQYLLLHYEAGHWDFAKGHLEAGEKAEQAARREIFEETGLKNIKLFNNFREVMQYWMWSYAQKKRGRPTRTLKTVTFFLGEAYGGNVRLSHEHTGYVWLPYNEAVKLATYKNAKDLIKKAEAFLAKH